MKYFRRIHFLLCLLLVFWTPVHAATMRLSEKEVTLLMGAEKTISINGSKQKAQWSLTNNTVAALANKKSSSVVIRPKHAGTTYLICQIGGKKLKCKIDVLNNRIGIEKDFRIPLKFDVVLISGVNTEILSALKKPQIQINKSYATFEIKKKGDKYIALLKGKKVGKCSLKVNFESGESYNFAVKIVPGMYKSGDSSEAAYKKWRRNWIKTVVTKDLSTWEVINFIGYLISDNKYGIKKGGATAYGLWLTGYGTCISGAEMMRDFLSDLGIKCVKHYAAKDNDPGMIYGSNHYNVHMWMGKSKFILNPQPGLPWDLSYVVCS